MPETRHNNNLRDLRQNYRHQVPPNPFPFPTQDQFGKITDIKWSIRWILLQKESMIPLFIDDDSLNCQTICPRMGTTVRRIN